ncbi:MAG: hypothetical protein ACT4NV_20010 [Rhodoferax sp.]
MPTPPYRLSTDQVRVTAFAPHGRIEVWAEGAFVYYEATGPFNREVIDCLAVAQRDFLLAHPMPGSWASLGVMHHSALIGEEALERYQELMSSPKPAAMAPVATAFVMGAEVEGRSLMAPLYERVYARIGRPFRVFPDLASAQAWLQQQLALADAPPGTAP